MADVDDVPVRRRGRLPRPHRAAGLQVGVRRQAGARAARPDTAAATPTPTTARSSAPPRCTTTARSGRRPCGTSATGSARRWRSRSSPGRWSCRAEQPVVPRHAQRDPAGRQGDLRRAPPGRASGRSSPTAAWASSPARWAATTALRPGTATCRRRRCAGRSSRARSPTRTRDSRWLECRSPWPSRAATASSTRPRSPRRTAATDSARSRWVTIASSRSAGPASSSATKSVTVTPSGATRDFAVRKDWAASSGGASIADFNGPDYSGFGCGPDEAIDDSQSSGWGSTTGDDDGTPTNEFIPKFIVIDMDRHVDISKFAVDPSATCGDGGSASTGGVPDRDLAGRHGLDNCGRGHVHRRRSGSAQRAHSERREPMVCAS